MQSLSLIDDFVLDIQRFLEAYGWIIVFCAFCLYMLKDVIAAASKSLSLRRANDPKRRKVFDSEVMLTIIHI